MYPVSENFKGAVRYSHRVITKAEVLRYGQLVATIYPDSGGVEVDSRSAIRRTCSVSLHAGGQSIGVEDIYTTYANLSSGYATYSALVAGPADYATTRVVTSQEITVEDDGLVPSSGLDILTPYGNELRLSRGIEYRVATDYTYSALAGDYATYSALASAVAAYAAFDAFVGPVETVQEFVPLGVFVITATTIGTDATGIAISLEGQDRALRISRARWLDPYQIPSGTNVTNALLDLVQDRYPDIVTRFSSTSATVAAVTLGLDDDNDPWADALAIAEAAGMDLYFDADGVCVLEPVPDYTVAATVETYREGEEAMLLTAQRVLSSDGVYNAVVVTAEGSDIVAPVRATALDEDPSSPTYVYGPFGLVPFFLSSPLVTTTAAAQNLATAKLNELRGTSENIAWSQIVDPSLDVGDIVAISNEKSKLARAMVLDRLSIPLDYSAEMTAQGRTIVFRYGDTVVAKNGEVIVTNLPSTGTIRPETILRSATIK